MASTTTPRLGLVKPTPGTGELVNVSTQINAAHDKLDAAVGAETVTSTTRPATPYLGKFIRESDTGKLYVCTGTAPAAWVQVPVGGTTAVMSDYIRVARPIASGGAFVAKVDGESSDRMIIDASGKIAIGSGSGAQDTTLYRSAANTLTTDDNFTVGGSVTCRSCNVGAHVIVTRTGALSIPSGGGGTDITWTAEQRDVGAMWGSGTGVTLPFTGAYSAVLNASWALQAGGVRSIAIKLGGGVVAENKMNTTGQSEPQSVATEFLGTAGQVVTAAGFQTSGVAVNLSLLRLGVRLTGQ